MNVQVRLFAIFREGRFKRQDLDVPDGTSTGDILSQLNIPEEQVGILLVNGRGAPAGQALTANDVVSIFPLVGGG